MDHKSYIDIQAAREDNIAGFEPGDDIVIQTKIDGANAAIRYDAEKDEIVAQSRKRILDSNNNLRGMYELSQFLNKSEIKKILGERYIVFGEYLCSHTVKYADENMNKFYCYDVYDLEEHCYLPQSRVRKFAETLGFNYVVTWYEGKFVSWDHCKSFLDRSAYGEEIEEGIVIKNQTKLNDENNRMPCYIKIVNSQFKETQQANREKKHDPNKLAENQQRFEMTETVVTKARVQKILNKAVDEGIIPEDYTVADMKDIVKWVPKEVVADCIKEEPNTVKNIENFSKYANKVTMNLVREIVTAKNI